MKIRPNGTYTEAAQSDSGFIQDELEKLYEYLFWQGYTASESEHLLFSAICTAGAFNRVNRSLQLRKKITLDKTD